MSPATEHPIQLVIRRGDTTLVQGCADEADVCTWIARLAEARTKDGPLVPADAAWTVEHADG